MENAGSRLTLGDFLTRNPYFQFHLPEHIESTRYYRRALKRFELFKRSFSRASLHSAVWDSRRRIFRRALRGVKSGCDIDWTRPDYWNTIPIVSKASLRERPEEFLNPKYESESLRYRPTSGTTGPPVPIWYSPNFYFESVMFSAYKVAWLAGCLPRARWPVFCFSLFDNKYLTESVWACPKPLMGLTLILVFDERDLSVSVRRLTDLLTDLRPEVLAVKPNILSSLIEAGDARLQEACHSIRLIICGGADLDDNLRSTALDFLGVPIVNAYGLSEFGGVASECSLMRGLHLYEQDVIAEIVQPDGTIAPVGSGELVLSSVANSAMPLLRFRTGDVIELIDEPCPCGLLGRRIHRISGRTMPNFVLRDGSLFAPMNVNRDMFSLFPIREFRITQTQVGRFQVEVDLRQSGVAPTEMLLEIGRYIESCTGFRAQAEVSMTTFPLGSKFQRYRVSLPGAVVSYSQPTTPSRPTT